MKPGYVVIGIIILIIVLFFMFRHKRQGQKPSRSQIAHSQIIQPIQTTIGRRTKTKECVVHGPLPDPDCTPGAVIEGVSKVQICTPGYAREIRNVPIEVKDEAYAEYGITHHSPGQYEVDHLISLGLGGSNDIANLWPEAANPRPGYHEKDKVENYLHKRVCDGKISLDDAQRLISSDWLSVYRKIPRGSRRKGY
jgi:hypothetical protein